MSTEAFRLTPEYRAKALTNVMRRHPPKLRLTKGMANAARRINETAPNTDKKR